MTNNLESNQVIVNNHIVNDSLYYNNEVMVQVIINYPSFESSEFKSFTNFLSNHYYSKLVLHSKYETYKLYRLAISDYEYALANNFPFRTFEYYLDYEVTYNDNCTLSLYYDTYTYTGGAHGSTIRKSDTWNLKEARLCSLSDYILDKDNYKEFVLKEITDTIASSQGTDDFMYFDDYRDLVVSSFQKDSFYLIDSEYADEAIRSKSDSTDGGIVIYFQQYDIAPYASGLPSFLIPFDNPNVIYPSC
ncbi:MAG: DUF3298 and DUF4163 domain-containing protein [Clostridiales bacterium]|nr:DUF3298 and DUF4163 domain-containing protein [Clostridiales bacterium]